MSAITHRLNISIINPYKYEYTLKMTGISKLIYYTYAYYTTLTCKIQVYTHIKLNCFYDEVISLYNWSFQQHMFLFLQKPNTKLCNAYEPKNKTQV